MSLVGRTVLRHPTHPIVLTPPNSSVRFFGRRTPIRVRVLFQKRTTKKGVALIVSSQLWSSDADSTLSIVTIQKMPGESIAMSMNDIIRFDRSALLLLSNEEIPI